MNEDLDNNYERPIVTSVGNAWVICNSKSRPGYKYYFNTLSGQSVWNLSPDEVEKAKKYTKALPISEIEKCPEPSIDPPMDPSRNEVQAGASRIYNEPFSSGQVPNQIPNMYPMSLMNINSMPGVPNIQGYNPLMWSNPLNNPAMPQPPVIFVAYPQANFQQPEEYQSFPTHKEELNNYNKNYMKKDNDMLNRSNRMHDIGGQSEYLHRNVQQPSNWNRNSSDLRQKLIRKRRNTLSYGSAPLDKGDEKEKETSYKDFRGVNKNIDIIETSSKYDLSALELLKSPHSKANNWFIVVDTEIILNNFPFLDKITDPDQDCYLLVPDHVLKELQRLVAVGGDVQTRRILRFLSQQIEAELAFKGNFMPRNASDEDDTYKTFATCEDLVKQNNVILLTNDIKFQKYKNKNTGVQIMTLNELKHILNNTHVKQPLRNNSPTLGIKIVVPNDKLQDIVVPKPKSATDFDVQSVIKQKETRTRSVSPLKPADSIQKNNENPRTQSSEQRSETDHTTLKTLESVGISKRPISPKASNENERIKLSRSNSTANADATPTRYRWRKRKASSVKSKAKSSSVINDKVVNTDSTKQEDASDANLMPESGLRSILPNPISLQAPSLGRSSISSQKKDKERNQPNITIEETSTSGVISNTTLDSETVSPVNLKKTVSVCEDVDFEMFSVIGQSMEEVLRTRREEWVLRFVQIMEETLKEVLRAESPQSKCHEYSAAWADLPELARGVIKKYSDHFPVVDAANRLSFKLQKIGRSEGPNIEPNQYMALYSFGVYLIKALKNVTEDCEDLNSADDSLKKLLYDIQNANLDNGPNDNFADELNESTINATKASSPKKGVSHEFINSAKEIDGKSINSANNFLSPSKGSQTEQIEKEPQQRSTNKKLMFFSSLALTKTSIVKSPVTFDFQNTHSSPNTSSVPQTPPQVSPSLKPSQTSPISIKPQTLQETANNNKDLSKSINDLNLNIEKDNTYSPIQTCFVRNFKSIPQFEEKINKGDSAFYEPADEDYGEDDYDEAQYHDEYYDHNGELYCDYDLEEGEIGNEDETAKDLSDTPNGEDNSCQKPNDEHEWFMKIFTDEIKQTIQIVLMLCSKFLRELKSSYGPSQDIQDELRTACASLSDIKRSLNSLLDSESTTPEDNVILLLKKANLDAYISSKELLLDYRNVISKCNEQVNTCHDKVTLIMKAAGIHELSENKELQLS